MAVSLSKGGNVSLAKEAPGIRMIAAGLGWDARATDGAAFDLDASIFMVNASGKVRSSDDFIFYRQLASKCGSVVHQGDNLTGDGDGDDEVIKVDLSKVPADITKLIISVTIHEAEQRGQNFGQVNNAFVRVVNEEGGAEVVRYDLSEDYSTETAMIFGELYRHNNDWKFRAVGQGYAGGLRAMAIEYGVEVA